MGAFFAALATALPYIVKYGPTVITIIGEVRDMASKSSAAGTLLPDVDQVLAEAKKTVLTAQTFQDLKGSLVGGNSPGGDVLPNWKSGQH